MRSADAWASGAGTDGSVSEPRVIVDARILDRPQMEHTGLGRYTFEVVRGLLEARPAWALTVLSNRPQLFGASTAVRTTRWPTASSLGRITWLQGASRLELLKSGADLWFGTAFVIPRWWGGPAAVTVHDLTFLLMPELYRGRLNALHAKWATRTSVTRARRVITVSEASRAAVLDRFDVAPARVAVIHNGVSDVFHTEPEDPDDPPYALFVGTFEARKGLDTLAAAAERLAQGGVRLGLVLAGRPGWGAGDALARLERHGARMVHDPSDTALAALYRGALAVIHLSRDEGFGLPVAEAMAAGTAVVSTDLPAVREFAHEVPFYVPVGDGEAVAEHLQTLVKHPSERAAHVAKGRIAARTLRWRHVAERHAKLLERALTA
ncbi:MAG: glycosyltransferase family 4 protein [Actinomycetota bacterium]|nr:glycosyltransferase family 4 protein [Actinomycetota bacterium]